LKDLPLFGSIVHRLADPMDQNFHLIRDRIGLLSANRVWRTYPGGRELDRLEGKPRPEDTPMAEDWIGSTTRAVNPGRESLREGVATVHFDGLSLDLSEAIKGHPDYFLGRSHLEAYGINPMLLVKFLDSAVRLHLQCHPTAAFARRFLGSPSGKTEAYVILSSRDEVPDPFIYLGFQRPPGREVLKEWIVTQNMPALLGCFDRVPVRPGDVFIIPGGLPHALGEGLFLVEVQEPSDLVVRFEFERAGYVIPQSARFMNRGLDFCLEVFDFRAITLDEVLSRYRPKPVVETEFPDGSTRERLIGPSQTKCFSVERLRVRSKAEVSGRRFSINIVTRGSCTLRDGRGATTLRAFDRFLCPHGLESIQVTTTGGVEILRCFPPVP